MGYWSINAALQDERYYGEKDGLEKGLEKGLVLGEKKLTDLLNWLIVHGWTEEVDQALNDLDYREQLYREET